MNVVSLNKEGVDADASDNEGDALPAGSAFVASPTTCKYDLGIWASPMDFLGSALSSAAPKSHDLRHSDEIHLR
jgi:hypothetical protein